MYIDAPYYHKITVFPYFPNAINLIFCAGPTVLFFQENAGSILPFIAISKHL